ncbi:uncharacterized protein LOC114357803 [Ostrinia furnacalis]|uniref:uncharacterized protein LOC114357803 n=1 Tax=Ostrinia furnacalis TaxID=93504 RepID=UPI00103CAF3C|nr:uncharacterized protein LOC114357803 [Ostrinia furnacalis]
MGKRRHHDSEEDHLAYKIRKLERKMAKVRRRRRKSYSSSENSSPHSRNSYQIPELDDHSVLLEASNIGEAPPEIISTDESREPEVVELDPEASTSVELAPEVLCLLGDAPEQEDVFGPNIHKDIASRWTEILMNGLKDESKKEILKVHKTPDNLKQVRAPKLNPEIKAAVNENVIKRDCIISEKQDLLSCTITHIANILTSVLTDLKSSSYSKDLLQSLSNTGKLLCHIHYLETMTRKRFLLACLNKDVKDNIKEAKHDHMLFGDGLQDTLKSIKAISKAGAELRPVTSKPKPAPKSNQRPGEPATRSLNWRGPPPPPPPPRRAAARQSSTAGGRRQQQQTARRPSDKRNARSDNKNSYRDRR